MYTNIAGITLPAIFDPVVIGILLNIIGIVIGSAFTQVSEEEKAAREKLFIVPEEEKLPMEMKKTLNYMKFAPWLGVLVIVILSIVWLIPYTIQ